MTFDEIVNSISDAEFKKTLLRGRYEELQRFLPSKRREEYISAIKKELPVEALTGKMNFNQDALINIAYVARAIDRIHPGWDKWDKDPELYEMKKQFMKAIEDLYNAQASLDREKRLKGVPLLGELYKAVGKLKDNHMEVFATETRPNGDIHRYHPVDEATKVTYRPKPKGSVGKNVAYGYHHDDNDKNTHVFFLGADGKHPIVFTERMINGQKTAIVGLTTCLVQAGTKRQYSEDHAFQQIVQALKDNLDQVENVIIDVRGNRGGVPDHMQKIANVICGCSEKKELPFYVEAHARKTEEANLSMPFYYAPPEFEKKNQLMSYQGRQKVFVLMDRETASAGELIYPLLKQYKGARFIGENTDGCVQYGAGSNIVLPCGGILVMGHTFLDFGTGFVEGKGFPPDINCPGRDAFQVACGQIGKDGNTLRKTLTSGSVVKTFWERTKKFFGG